VTRWPLSCYKSGLNRLFLYSTLRLVSCWAPVACAYNPSYLWGWGWEDGGSRSAQQQISRAQWTGGMVKWESACLAGVKPRVQTPLPSRDKNSFHIFSIVWGVRHMTSTLKMPINKVLLEHRLPNLSYVHDCNPFKCRVTTCPFPEAYWSFLQINRLERDVYNQHCMQ
jgi:hypothetical protein